MLLRLWAFQISKGWITIDQIPEFVREKVQKIIDENEENKD